MKKTLFLLVLCTQFAYSQTNVSGGIFSNTTWTLAGSPYIVTDTVVVFPGVTLTIAPGVTVKFADGKYMEIRQGALVAAGTVTDSITFTSASVSPGVGVYKGIWINSSVATIDYCIFKYANYSMYGTVTNGLLIQHSYFYMNGNCYPDSPPLTVNQSSFYNNTVCFPATQSITIKKSSFYNNSACLGIPVASDCIYNVYMDSCTFQNNTCGVYMADGHITNSTFLDNGQGVRIRGAASIQGHSFRNCIFCNNGYGINMWDGESVHHDTVVDCNFSHNGIAARIGSNYMTGNIMVDNDTAAYLGGGPSDLVSDNYIYHNQVGALYGGNQPGSFFNNYICNNSLYNIIYTSNLNGSIPPVCYCDTDSATIRSKIYDGYVDISHGLLYFTPFVSCDSSAITSIPPLNCVTVITTGIEEQNNFQSSAVTVYPNPAHGSFTISFSNQISNFEYQISIYDVMGREVYNDKIINRTSYIVNQNLSPGVYFVKVTAGGKVWAGKVVVE